MTRRLDQAADRLRAQEGLQALGGVLLLLALLPLLFRMQLGNFEYFLRATAWQFLARGLWLTLEVAAVSIALSLPLATLFALGRLAGARALRWPAIGLIEGVRALPILLFIYFIGRGLTRSGFELSAFWPVVVALTLYTTAVNAETIRSGILSLDSGQWEAAHALGLSYAQRMRLVILPQAFRRVLPPLVAQFATVVKDTSLGYIVGLLELTRRGEIIYQGQFNPLETIYIVAIIYFFINYLLGQLAHAIERWLSTR
jgi:His/Glu/Gln/Arg/opine family amino acid ABC transporter permease subunit